MLRWLVILTLLLWAPAAEAGSERVALVVGNGAYRDASVLPNAVNDARAMAAALRRVGFEVLDGIDLDRAGLYALLKRYALALDDARVAVFFYAGHGMQVAGENYLVPVDARLEDELDLRSEALPVKLVLDQVERTDRTSIVFLDACRDNPFAQRIKRSIGRGIAVASGLAAVDGGIGTLIAYATQPDNVAADGSGGHSPFTAALLAHLETPGLEVSQLMKRVRQDVITSTDHMQVPWDHSSLVGDFYFVPPAPGMAQAAAPATVRSEEQSYWDGTQQVSDPGRKLAALEGYLQVYPKGGFAGLARLQIDDLKAAEHPAAPSPDQRRLVTEPLAAPRATPAEQAEQALALGRGDRQAVQLQLTRLGFDTRGNDGAFGPRTRAAIAGFQEQAKLPATGYLDAPTLARLATAAAAPGRLATRDEPQPAPRAAPVAPAPIEEPSAGSMVQCRGPKDPAWVDFRLITFSQCRALGGSWTLP